MYKCINGWTKAKMLKVVRAREYKVACVDPLGEGEGDYVCTYLNKKGNKCAVGLFIPDGHKGQAFAGEVNVLLKAFPDLKKSMPLREEAMMNFQNAHDIEGPNSRRPFEGNAKAAMIDWIKKNVKE